MSLHSSKWPNFAIYWQKCLSQITRFDCVPNCTRVPNQTQVLMTSFQNTQADIINSKVRQSCSESSHWISESVLFSKIRHSSKGMLLESKNLKFAIFLISNFSHGLPLKLLVPNCTQLSQIVSCPKLYVYTLVMVRRQN